MPKKEVNIKINEYKIKTKGILNNDIITCFDNDELKTKTTFDFKNQVLTRENNEQKIVIDFSSKTITNTMKEKNKTFLIEFNVLKLIIKNKEAIINYQIGEDNFNFRIYYE